MSRSTSNDSKTVRHETQVVAQPGVTLYNGKDQTPVGITNRHTGEVVSFGKRLGERTFKGVHAVLTVDEENELWWILAIDTESGAMYQNGFLHENHQIALATFVGGSEDEIRKLMQEPPPSN